jgi:hypothetical protein
MTVFGLLMSTMVPSLVVVVDIPPRRFDARSRRRAQACETGIDEMNPIDEPFMASGQYYAPANFTKYPDTETAATEEK